jgi:hypothetical protein
MANFKALRTNKDYYKKQDHNSPFMGRILISKLLHFKPRKLTVDCDVGRGTETGASRNIM